MPDVSLTGLIYHFILARLIQSDNNKIHVARKIKASIRMIRDNIAEMRNIEYPVPTNLSGVTKWTEKEKQDYENWTGIDCTKRRK
jgi:hypothetical protein